MHFRLRTYFFFKFLGVNSYLKGFSLKGFFSCSKPMNYMIRMALIPENLYKDENENLVEFRNLSFLKQFI